MVWEFIFSAVAAVGSVAGSIWAIKAVIKHEKKNCDARLEAFKEGLNYEKGK